MGKNEIGLMRRRLLGYRETSTFGSNRRRMFSRCTLLACLFLAGYHVALDLAAGQARPTLVEAGAAVVWSVVFFVMVVLAIPFLTSHDFRPNAARLGTDTLLSISMNILSFGLLYQHFPPVGDRAGGFLDAVYFSAVTFSTLGYGDFAPHTSVRLAAAAQAIIGNLHLGIIVGTAFLATQLPGRRASALEEN